MPTPEKLIYFGQLEQLWTQRAQGEGLINQLVVVDTDDRPGFYDVLHIGSDGKAKRVGGFAGTDHGDGALAIGRRIEELGAEGIKLLQEKGFSALFQMAWDTSPRIWK